LAQVPETLGDDDRAFYMSRIDETMAQRRGADPGVRIPVPPRPISEPRVGAHDWRADLGPTHPIIKIHCMSAGAGVSMRGSDRDLPTA
jgi:hypothetical protein